MLRLRNELTRSKAETKSLKDELKQRESGRPAVEWLWRRALGVGLEACTEAYAGEGGGGTAGGAAEGGTALCSVEEGGGGEAEPGHARAGCGEAGKSDRGEVMLSQDMSRSKRIDLGVLESLQNPACDQL